MKKRKKNIPSKNKRKRKQNKERNSRRRVAKNQKRKVKKNKNKANSQKSNRKQIYSEFLQNFFGSQNYNYQDESEYSDYEDEYSYEYSENPFYPFLNDYKDHSLSRYLKDMKRYAKRTATKQPYIPFNPEITDYVSMSNEQLKYYFYWRSQARNHYFIDTDHSYFNLYFIEILNMIEVKTPEDALEQLIETYRYLILSNNFNLTSKGLYIYTNAIFDFAYYHKISFSKLSPLIWNNLTSWERILLSVDFLSKESPIELPFEIISEISQFEWEKRSKIYGNEDIRKTNTLIEALINTFYVLDALRQKQEGEGLIGLSKSSYPVSLYFEPFENMIMDYDAYDRSIEPKINFSVESISYVFNSIIQEVENYFRNFLNIRGRLRKYQVDPWIKKNIINFLESKYKNGFYPIGFIKPAQDYLAELEKSKSINLDTVKIEKLRKETETVQEIMNVIESEEISYDPLAYIEPLTFVLSALVKIKPELIRLLSDLIENPDDENVNSEIINFEDIIHQHSERFLNQPLLFKKNGYIQINNEFLTSLKYIFEHKEEYSFLNIKVTDQAESNAINELIENFTNTEKKFLRIILSIQNPSQALEELANSEMTMTELIFDDINNKALLYLDDIILEMDENNIPFIINEYLQPIKIQLEKVKNE